MRNIVVIVSAAILLGSCVVFYGTPTTKLVRKLEMGMTKARVVKIMGNDYQVEAMRQTDRGQIEVLHYTSYSYPAYLIYFLNDTLVEFHRYTLPTHHQGGVSVTAGGIGITVKDTDTRMDDAALAGLLYLGSDTKDVDKKISTDILGNTIIEDNKGNKKTIRKDILGNTIIEDNQGNKVTVRTDILGNKIIEDNKGNKRVVKKDIQGNIQIKDY